MYYEEPTMPCNADMFKHIKEKSGLPLATGERSYTRWGFRQFFEDRTLNVIQPDLANTGGITETKKICDMAQVYDLGVQIHVAAAPSLPLLLCSWKQLFPTLSSTKSTTPI